MKTRRRFLQGSGVSLSLPWLESLATGSGGRLTPPLRAAFLHFPNGAWMDDWTPVQTGTSYTLSPILQPLAAVQSEVLVLTGLDKANSQDGGGHKSATANYLTGMPVRQTLGSNLSAGGISADQILAQNLRGQTPVASLVLGCEPVRTGVDRITNYTLLYDSLISWETPDRPVIPELNPRTVYDGLFGISEHQGQRIATNRRLLDLVLDDARSLRPRLGRDDRTRLDQYLDSVQSAENRLRFFEQTARDRNRESLWRPSAADTQRFSTSRQLSYTDRVQLMNELVVLAFRGDATRTIAMMLANDETNQTFQHIGVPENAHHVSHHQGNAEQIDRYRRITTWYVQQFADLVTALRNIPEGEGTLLDHCLLLFGSGLSDGNRHDPLNLPVVMAGRGGGSVPVGQHLRFTGDNTPLCNLHCSILNAMGLPANQFGDSNGRIF